MKTRKSTKAYFCWILLLASLAFLTSKKNLFASQNGFVPLAQLDFEPLRDLSDCFETPRGSLCYGDDARWIRKIEGYRYPISETLIVKYLGRYLDSAIVLVPLISHELDRDEPSSERRVFFDESVAGLSRKMVIELAPLKELAPLSLPKLCSSVQALNR